MMEYSVTQEVSRNENENVPTTEVSLRRSQREKSPAISNDYEVYLNECDYDVGLESDPTSYGQAINSENSTLWIYAMEEQLKSMKDNEVWDIVELPKGIKTIGCKWIFKTKHDSKGNVKRYKARLVAKEYTKKEGINYKETFSLISKKDSLRIVMTLVAHFDLELHQMDVKTAFLNDDLHEEVYMDQLEGFQDKGKAHMDLFCKLQCPKNDLEKKQMDKIPYAYAIGSIMYAQVCTRPDIAYVVGLLG
ncbi:Retrovirus-related Pol polyprotein from transposon TNT 1-94 [Vitis vinifera]|uniref:Retrovirus-related Pol polyprotein from transposon TNT 1-94 n=1 Tax=Vitis vinifera TaxID=29760 RepID=A0A438F4Z4_VITVI|nr:Retrovirus-related Pol polyprotein from transposon TNT 1-94 [Vitis vinifera]